MERAPKYRAATTPGEAGFCRSGVGLSHSFRYTAAPVTASRSESKSWRWRGVGGCRAGRASIAHGVTLGRADTNTVVLTDYHLSGEHGQIFREGDQLRLPRPALDQRLARSSAATGASPVDAACQWEIAVARRRPPAPGRPRRRRWCVAVRRAGRDDAALEAAGAERDRASRSIIDLPGGRGQVEDDPAAALRIYKALQPVGRPRAAARRSRRIAEAIFELLPRATHVAILLRSEADKDRFTVACRATGATERPRGRRRRHRPERRSVRASRAVLRRVLARARRGAHRQRAARSSAASESIMGGRDPVDRSACRCGAATRSLGVIQADNRASAGHVQRARPRGARCCSPRRPRSRSTTRAGRSGCALAEERLRGENSYLKGREEKRRFAEHHRRVDRRCTTVLQPARQGDRHARHRLHRGRDRHRQGADRRARSTTRSRRRDKLFVAQNCAALPENLLERELFGHKKGAFTGADHDKKGLFEIADGGTLFLDEIGEMPLGAAGQAPARAAGGRRSARSARPPSKQVDVRIICATNRDLADEVETGRFRQDLYYRLKVFPLRLPPLRERREDIPLLAAHFLRTLHRTSIAQADRRLHARRRSTRCAPTTGRATSASSRTRCSASSSRPSRARFIDARAPVAAHPQGRGHCSAASRPRRARSRR